MRSLIFTKSCLPRLSVGISTVVFISILLCFAMIQPAIITPEQDDDYNRKKRDQLAKGCQLSGESDYYLSTKESAENSEIVDVRTETPVTIFQRRRRFHTPALRIVHLDLKGAAPKLSFLQKIFRLISKAGANGILVEYEDMFPYWGSVVNASARNAYTTDEIKQVLQMADDNGLEVIPLVQTFGHMEHVLKLKEFVSLREVQNYPQAICPSQPDSFALIKTMIDQVIQLHPKIKFFHIGCDEVYQLAQCSKCKERIRKGALNKYKQEKFFHSHKASLQEPSSPRGIFLDHVKRLATYLRDNYNVQSIMWDDMLRTMSINELIASGITANGLVEPMVWVYIEDIDHFVSGPTWRTYSTVFPHVWAASAFKGAFGERLLMTDLLRHYRNHLSWLEVMARENGPFGHGLPTKFRGLALTGWSRYDHFAVLCELLPVAVPSLVLNLVTVTSAMNASEENRFRRVENLLECPVQRNASISIHLSVSKLETDPQQKDLRHCNFPGSEVFDLAGTLVQLKNEVEMLDKNSRENQGWLTGYNIRHNYTSPWRLIQAIGGHGYLVKILKDFAHSANETLITIFEQSTVDEWLEQNVVPLQEKVDELLQVVQNLTARKSWPRRPLA